MYTRWLRPAHISVFFAIVLVFVMLTGVHNRYLWSMDEPREAEIARETLVDGHWITPHLCGLPFLEKPPLFYDLIAGAYALTGSISPTVARIVPVIFGIIMLAAVFWFCNRWAGARTAWFSVLVLVTMPKFYYYSHLILLDIAVGAFSTVALVAFAFWLWWPGSNVKNQALLCLFYLASAGAFMSKGVIGVFHIVVIVGAFCIITQRWQTLRKLICAWPILVFIIPVVMWIYLFYREGGVGYLFEFFVNNVIGRFFKKQFVLPGVHFYNTDLGRTCPWYFYIYELPSIAGAIIVILPLTIWDAAVKIKTSQQPLKQNRNLQIDVWPFLLIWAVLPVFLLSFPAAKEKSYIIPSYAAMAILVGAWLNERLPKTEGKQWQGVGCFLIVAAVAVLGIFWPGMNAITYMIIAGFLISLTILIILISLRKKEFNQAFFAAIAVALCLPILYYAPNVQLEFRPYNCALTLVKEVWTRVDDVPLYMYRPRDIVRGSVSFYKNRTVHELDTPEELYSVLTSGQKVFVLVEEKRLGTLRNNNLVANLYTVQLLPDCGLDKKFMLLTNLKN